MIDVIYIVLALALLAIAWVMISNQRAFNRILRCFDEKPRVRSNPADKIRRP